MEQKKMTTDKIRSRYLQEHPEEIDNHVDSAFDEFERNHDIHELLSSLNNLGHIKAKADVQKLGPEHFHLPQQR